MDNKETWPHEQPLHDVPMDRQIVELNRTVAKLTAQLEEARREIDRLHSVLRELHDREPQHGCGFLDLQQFVGLLQCDALAAITKQKETIVPHCCDEPMRNITTQEVATWGDEEFKCGKCGKEKRI